MAAVSAALPLALTLTQSRRPRRLADPPPPPLPPTSANASDVPSSTAAADSDDPANDEENGWTPPQESVAETYCDHAECYQLMHEHEQARLSTRDKRAKIAISALSSLVAGTQLVPALQIPSSTVVLALLILVIGVAHTVLGMLEYDVTASKHAVQGSAWLEFYGAAWPTLQLDRDERPPRAAFFSAVTPRYTALRAKTDALLTLGIQTRFRADLASQTAARIAAGMGGGCGCAQEGIRVPSDLGGLLVHTQSHTSVRRHDGDGGAAHAASTAATTALVAAMDGGGTTPEETAIPVATAVATAAVSTAAAAVATAAPPPPSSW